MKKNYKSVILLLVFSLVVVLSLTGCSQSNLQGDAYDEDLEMPEQEWPEYMPDSVPEFTAGRIVHAQGTVIYGEKNIRIGIVKVTREAFDSYIAKLDESEFKLLNGSEKKGAIIKAYVFGENTISLQFDADNSDLTISYTGS